MKINVTYLDGRVETVNATAKVQVAVERKYDIELFRANRREHVFFAAWTGLRHAGKESLGFEEFIEVLDDASFDDDGKDDLTDPTSPDH